MSALQNSDVTRYAVLDVLTAKQSEPGRRKLPTLEIFDRVTAHLARATVASVPRRDVLSRSSLLAARPQTAYRRDVL